LPTTETNQNRNSFFVFVKEHQTALAVSTEQK